MKLTWILAVAAAQMAAPSPRPVAKGSAEQRASYERGQERQAEFERHFFAEAGFQPLSARAADKRAVKRAVFQDPYFILPIPGVEIERRQDGSVTLTMIARTGSGASTILPRDSWARLTGLEGSSFRPKPYVPWDPPKSGDPVPPAPPICHGWIVRIETADESGVGHGSWAQCGGDQPERAFATEIARLAVATRPACDFNAGNPFWSFATCFASRPPA